MTDDEMASLKSRISSLQKVYFVLFIGSLAVLAFEYLVLRNPLTMVVWVLMLGGAVATRLYRNSLVNKYNAELDGRLS
ncbi:MAG TPA: hypothetical protein VGM56_16670 [Byssovorax sp.]|jgi:hypothetical protein